MSYMSLQCTVCFLFITTIHPKPLLALLSIHGGNYTHSTHLNSLNTLRDSIVYLLFTIV